jgi:uncharacterized protein YyaL (SSP411 family)
MAAKKRLSHEHARFGRNALIDRIRKQILGRCAIFWKLRERIAAPAGAGDKPDMDSALRSSMKWLCLAQDSVEGGGVSTAYDLRQGWLVPFPETTGYIIPTFFNFAAYSGETRYRDRAMAMLAWLVGVQNPDGSIQAVIPGLEKPVVFDTGQALFGFLRGFTETREEAYLDAALKCGDWLRAAQDADGKWTRHEFLDTVHAYNTRVAWALVELARIAGKSAYGEAAYRNLEWASRRQRGNGWFENNAFSPEQPTYTHTIAYVTRGFLECGVTAGRPEWIQKARLTADAARSLQRPDGSLYGSYGPAWEPTASSSCLTGNAQLAFIWLRLYQLTGDETYRNSARRAIDYLIRRQGRSGWFGKIRGAIAGSYPIDGNYLPYVYPNWAAKFFCDLLMLDGTLDRKDTGLIFY